MAVKGIIRKCALFLGTIFIGFILCFVLLTFITQTSFFRQWLLTIINHQTRNRWGISLSIEQIKGNLFTDLSFHSVTLQNQKGEYISLDRLQITFSPYELFRRRLSFPLLSLT